MEVELRSNKSMGRPQNRWDDDEKFRIKTYGFGELAQLYLPDATPMSASNRLRIWITRNKSLMRKLSELGYAKGMRLLTPEMVKEIVAVIGEP